MRQTSRQKAMTGTGRARPCIMPALVAAGMLLATASAWAMGGGGGGGSGGGGAGGGMGGGMGSGGMGSGGMGSGSMGNDMSENMHDHEAARTQHLRGSVPALADMMKRMRARYPGGKILDVRLQQRNGRNFYIFSIMDRQNRLHRVRVPLSGLAGASSSKRYNFNGRR